NCSMPPSKWPITSILSSIPEKGYVRIEREWDRGDSVELTLPMRVQRVRAHELVIENRNYVAWSAAHSCTVSNQSTTKVTLATLLSTAGRSWITSSSPVC